MARRSAWFSIAPQQAGWVKQYSSELRSDLAGSVGGGNSVAYAAFQARMSNRSVTTLAGIGTSWSKMARTSGLSSWPAAPAGAGSGISASRNRCTLYLNLAGRLPGHAALGAFRPVSAHAEAVTLLGLVGLAAVGVILAAIHILERRHPPRVHAPTPRLRARPQ
jgi:hypothetical protein